MGFLAIKGQNLQSAKILDVERGIVSIKGKDIRFGLPGRTAWGES